MTVVTRFAPSPTGFLHIGGARTALFNYYFAKHNKGKFLLRIEDTDQERSTQQAVDAILDSMKWLGLDWDGDIVYQSKCQERHKQVAEDLYKKQKAYYCQCSKEQLQDMREQAMNEGRQPGYDGRCRNKNHTSGALRLLTLDQGSVTLKDQIQGDVTIQNDHIDDMIILRSDGTPTYMLSVVVDDHDMGITHIVRGDDHLTNAFRQHHLYTAMGWAMPTMAHMPLIHGQDGAKLSKRHGALGAETYRDMGFLPEAMRNYLLRLGWGYGDEEIISDARAIELFTLDRIGKSPSRFDLKKLEHLNSHYIRESDDDRLVKLVTPLLEGKLGKSITDQQKSWILKGMDGLKQRAKTLIELTDNAAFYAYDTPIEITDEKAEKFADAESRNTIKDFITQLEKLNEWTHDSLHSAAKDYAEKLDLKLVKIAQPIRVALTGTTISPGVFDVLEVLGKKESLKRLKMYAYN